MRGVPGNRHSYRDSRALIHQMHGPERKLRARLDRQVKRLSRKEIAAIEKDLAPPSAPVSDYRRYAHV